MRLAQGRPRATLVRYGYYSKGGKNTLDFAVVEVTRINRNNFV